MGDFSGLQIALSSLYAQRKALDVTGQNLSNVNTEGYSRQRVDMVSNSGPLTPAMYSKWVGTGQGVLAGSVQRLRDQFMEVRGHQEHATDEYLKQVQGTYAQIEQVLAEPSDTGIGSQLADFWAGWDDVANRPDDLAARAQLLQRAQTLADGFRQADGIMAGQIQTNKDQLDATVAEVNATAARIAELNQTIQAAVGSGLSPNDLQDQRDVLISKLAETVGATTKPGQVPGTLDVYVGGTALVRGTRAETLDTYTNPSPPNATIVRWTKDQLPAAVGGQAQGMLDAIDTTLPSYRASLDAVAQQVMSVTNTAHAAGYDLNGNPAQAFFVANPAGGIDVNPALMADPTLVAASNSATATLDGSIAKGLAASTGPDATYRQLVVKLGVDAQSANRRVDIQSAITTQVDAARDSEAGVNIDEEMTNLIQYQHAYDAAAKFMSVVDSTLDTLINGLGL